MGYTGNRNWTIDATKQKLASTLSFRMLRAKSLMVSDHSSKINRPRELRSILFICSTSGESIRSIYPKSQQEKNSRGYGLWGKFNHILKICFLKNCFAKKLWLFAKRSTITSLLVNLNLKEKKSLAWEFNMVTLITDTNRLWSWWDHAPAIVS